MEAGKGNVETQLNSFQNPQIYNLLQVKVTSSLYIFYDNSDIFMPYAAKNDVFIFWIITKKLV